MDDLQVTSSSETPEQIQESLFEAPTEIQEAAPAPEAPVEAPAEGSPAPEPEADLTKYTAKQIHENPRLRIQKATAEAAQAKREAAAARAEVEAMRSRYEQKAKPEPPPGASSESDPEPQEADFTEYRDFVKAQARWGAREVMREERQAAAAAHREQQVQRSVSERVGGYQKQIEAAGGQAFIDSLTPDVLNISPDGPLGVAIMESDMAAQIMTYLRDNPDEIRALSSLHPVRAFRAIGRIEGKLAGVAVTANAPRAVSKAKPPVRPVAGSANSGNESLDELPFEEYFKRENARERQAH